MTRIPDMTRDETPEELRAAFDSVIAANNGSFPMGPGAVILTSPEMASRRLPLSGYMRSQITLPGCIQELAILTTARCLDCAYVWNAHAGFARKAGVSDAMIAAIRENKPLPSASADETIVVQYGLELMRDHAVSEQTFNAALAQFGKTHLVELTALMGHYALNAFLLIGFEVDLPEGSTEPRLPMRA